MKDFMIGCNYWASNAGMYMWRRFDASVVEKDFQLLAKHGVNTLRIFPLWPDFQPVENQLVNHDRIYPLRNGDELFKNPAGLDEKQLENFGIVLDLAEKYNFKVIVALITGWMSGRLFMPPFLMNKNPINDPFALVWECRFIKEFVPRFSNRNCILAWEPGNECNCLDSVLMKEHGVTPEQAELWLSAITNAIRAADPTRPIYSGMHFTRINNDWNAGMLAYYTDMQTTHPYPAFTDYCDKEGLNEMRASLHAAAESVYVADISNQPCLVEEIGSLSPITLSDNYLPEYIEKSLFSSFQYNTTGYLWWCAFEQNTFDFAPYDQTPLERELGLAYQDHTPKSNLIALNKMGKIVKDIGELPPHQKDAVIIITQRDRWGADWITAYGAFCMAAQAGYNLKFSHNALPLEDSDHYIFCVTYSGHFKEEEKLLKKVKNGAKLLISFHGGYMANFEKWTGLNVVGRENRNITHNFTFNGKEISLSCPINLILNADKATVLARDQEGNIVLSENKIGKGCVYFLNAALENSYTKTYKPTETNMSEIYSFFLKDVKKPITFNTNQCTITYHEYSPEKIGVLITNFSDINKIEYTLDQDWIIENSLYSSAEKGVLELNERFACIFLKKKL